MPSPKSALGRPQRAVGSTRRSVRIDDHLFLAARQLANLQGTTLRDVIERGLALQVTEETVLTQDQTLGPLIDQVLQERHMKLEKGLRSMIARVGYEVLRTKYVLLNFLDEANVPADKIDEWHKQGWQYAVKEFRRQQDWAEISGE